MLEIARTTSIEDLVTLFPAAVKILVRHNLPCLVCGEPAWEEPLRSRMFVDWLGC